MLGVQRFSRTYIRGLLHQLVPPVIASGLQVDRSACAFIDHNILHRRARLQRFLHGREQLHLAAAAVRAILRHNGGRLRVVNAVDQRVGGESAEHDGVGCSNAGAGEHGDRQFRSHAHVDRDPVALLYSERLQHVGELLHLTMQLLIGQSANLARLALPDDGGLVLAAGLDMAVDAVVGEVELSPYKPLSPRAVPLQHPVPLFEPVQLAGHARPEFIRIVYRLFVQAFIFVHAFDVRLLAELGWRGELSLLLQDGVDVGGVGIDDGFLGHDEAPSTLRISLAPAKRREFAGVYSTQEGQNLPGPMGPGPRGP